MPDMMMFPKTVDEFMEQYKIVDSDEVYTNGTELVPIFRMKQWFEHIDVVEIVRCKDCVWCDEHGYCNNHEMFVENRDWFCADGERR